MGVVLFAGTWGLIAGVNRLGTYMEHGGVFICIPDQSASVSHCQCLWANHFEHKQPLGGIEGKGASRPPPFAAMGMSRRHPQASGSMCRFAVPFSQWFESE